MTFTLLQPFSCVKRLWIPHNNNSNKSSNIHDYCTVTNRFPENSLAQCPNLYQNLQSLEICHSESIDKICTCDNESLLQHFLHANQAFDVYFNSKKSPSKPPKIYNTIITNFVEKKTYLNKLHRHFFFIKRHKLREWSFTNYNQAKS